MNGPGGDARQPDTSLVRRAVALAEKLDLATSALVRPLETALDGESPPAFAQIADCLRLPPPVFLALLRIAQHEADSATRPSSAVPAGGTPALQDTRVGVAWIPEPTRAPAHAPPQIPGTILPGVDDTRMAAGAPPALVAGPAPGKRERVGRYELHTLVGAGGMGVVYRAWDSSLQRTVALKLLRPGLEPVSPVGKERFLREGRAAARLRHPGIVAVHDVGEDDGRLYLAMEFIEGSTLATCLAGGIPAKLDGRAGAFADLPRDIERLATVAEAVGYAHQNRIVHRDLKPANILIDREGRPLVVDFGLAKDLTDSERGAGPDPARLTQSGDVIGTPGYLSPEQAGGEALVLAPSDVFSLGVMLYEFLTGRPPFRRESVPVALQSVLHDDVVPPRRWHARLAPDLETVCLKCLERDPARRYADAAALAADLRRWLAGEPVEARPVAFVRRAARWVRRHKAISAALALALAVAVTAASVQAWQGSLYRERMSAQRDFARTVEAAEGARRSGSTERLRDLRDLAEQQSERVLQVAGEQGQVHLLRGRLRFLAGDVTGARHDLDRAVDLLGAGDGAPWAKRARLGTEQYRRMMEEARQRIEDPDRAAAARPADLEKEDPRLGALRTSALEDLEAAAHRGVGGPEQALVQAYHAYLVENWELVRVRALDALQLEVSAEAYWLCGSALLQQGSLDRAIEALNGAVLLDRGFADAWITRADARAAEGEDLYHRWIPEIMSGKRPLGDADVLELKLRGAIGDVLEAKDRGGDPNRAAQILARVAFVLGELVRKSDPLRLSAGQPAGVRRILRPYLDLIERLDPRYCDALVLFRLGQLWECYGSSDPERQIDSRDEMRHAIDCFTQAIERKPGFTSAYYWRANAYYGLATGLRDLGENPRACLHRAIADYSRNFELDPKNDYAILYRGVAHTAIGDWAREHEGDFLDEYRVALEDLDAPAVLAMDIWEPILNRARAREFVTLETERAGRDAEPDMRRVLADLARLDYKAVSPGTPLVEAWALWGIAASRTRAGKDALEECRRAERIYLLDAEHRFWGLLWAAEARALSGDSRGALTFLARRAEFPDSSRYVIREDVIFELLERLAGFLADAPAEPALAAGALDLAKAAVRLAADVERERLRRLAFLALSQARRHCGLGWADLSRDPELASLQDDERWGK